MSLAIYEAFELYQSFTGKQIPSEKFFSFEIPIEKRSVDELPFGRSTVISQGDGLSASNIPLSERVELQYDFWSKDLNELNQLHLDFDEYMLTRGYRSKVVDCFVDPDEIFDNAKVHRLVKRYVKNRLK